MHHILRTLRSQWLGAIGILLGVTGVAFGATGQPALLGKLNQADKPTIIQNTANGPAATFKTSATKPPFTVTSSKKVPNLNASKLGGKRPSAFAPAGSSYTKADSDDRYPGIGDVYTRAQSNGKYAPQTGSTEYQSVDAVQVRLGEAAGFSLVAGGGNTQILVLSSFTAPVAGTLVVRATGNGTFAAPSKLILLAGASSQDLVGPQNGGFSFELQVHLNANGTVVAYLYAQNPAQSLLLVDAVLVSATFVPD